jgi:hypothetical protein
MNGPCAQCGTVRRCHMYQDRDHRIVYLCRACARELGFAEPQLETTMEPEVAPHDAKRNLIETALGQLIEAREIDERETLPTEIEKWTAWYDATIPLVTDIETIAGAMRVEFHTRRGERLVAEPENLGGRPSFQETMSRRDIVSEKDRQQRKKQRALGRQAEAARTYIKTEVAAGRKPSVKGALRHVKGLAGRPASRPKSRRPSRAAQSSPSTPSNQSAPYSWIGTQARAAQRTANTLAALDTVANGECWTDRELTRVIGLDVERYLPRVRLIPWLSIDRRPEGTVFRIDGDLRNICEGRAPRPEVDDLDGRSLGAFLKHLRGEITRRRKENHDEFRKRRWSSEVILRREQSDLLDWIEEQLDRVPC